MKRFSNILLLLLAPGLFMQAWALSFRNISTSDGLSHPTVISSCQSKDGRLWFASHDGIDAYDGYDFRKYCYVGEDGSLQPFKKTQSVVSDRSGDVWAINGNSLYRLDAADDVFRLFYVVEEGPLHSILPAGNGILLAFTRAGAKTLDTCSGREMASLLPGQLAGLNIRMAVMFGEIVALGISSGEVALWDMKNGSVEWLRCLPAGISLKTMLMSRDVLWVGTEGEGLFRINLDTRQAVRMTRKDGLLSNMIRALCYDDLGRLWVGTYDGLNIISGDGQMSAYAHDPSDRYSLSVNSVRSITKDSQGGMWLTTFYGGVNYWNPLSMPFERVTPATGPFSVSAHMQRIMEDDEGCLWMGISDNGLVRYNPLNGKFSSFRLPDDKVSSRDIKCIFEDKEHHRLLIGSQFGSLETLNLADGSSATVEAKKLGKAVYDIHRISDELLYLCTRRGLWTLELKPMKASPVIVVERSESCNCMITDASGIRWIGCNEGVLLLDDSDGEPELLDLPEQLEGLSEVMCIYESVNGDIYICGNRFLRYNPSSRSVREIGEDEGLSAKVIGVVEDQYERLWLYTSNGLCRYDTSSGVVRTIGEETGLSPSAFGSASICRTRTGMIYVGCMDGVFRFDPEWIQGNPFCPEPEICVEDMSGRRLKGDLRLGHDENNLKFSFSTLNYSCSGHEIFSFRLKGYDRDWRTQVGDNKVSYYNIPSGHYVFELRSANNDGVWNKTTVSVPVVIRTFWAKTLLARVLFALLLLAVIVFVFRAITQHREKMYEEEMHRLKESFFITFLGELKTPLTLITSPLQEMISRAEGGWMKRQLRYVERNSRRLGHLVGRLTAFRKADMGLIPLNVKRCHADMILRDICSCYDVYASDHGIAFSYASQLDSGLMVADPQYLDLMVNNVLGGFFRGCSGGTLTVRSFEEDGNLVVEVVRSGSDAPANIEGVELSLASLLAEKHMGSLVFDKTRDDVSVRIVIPQDESIYPSAPIEEEGSYVVSEVDMDMLEDVQFDDVPEDASSQKNACILLLVSDRSTLSYLSEGLSKSFEIRTASGVDESMSLLIQGDVDAVVTDISDRSDKGLSLCTRMKQDPSTRNIPFVVISASSDSSSDLSALKAGADDCIRKPFSISILSVKLRNLVQSRREVSMSQPASAVPDNPEDFVSRAEKTLRMHLSDERYGANDLVRDMGMSRTSFYTRLKNMTGQGPVEFIHSVRFKEACRMLLETECSMVEISEAVGFSSASYFTRAFKKHFGMLPSEYRHQN